MLLLLLLCCLLLLLLLWLLVAVSVDAFAALSAVVDTTVAVAVIGHLVARR